MKEMAKKGLNFKPYENKYQTWMFIKYIKEDWFRTMFEMNRNLPNVLKLICYGKKDHFFTEDLLSEKAIHYCYKNKLNPTYDEKLKHKY